MEIESHLKAIQEHAVALADAAERAGLDAPVPTAPEWQVRDLVGHQGQVHRWAATYVTTGRNDPGAELEGIPVDGELLTWFRAGHARLVDAISNAPADLETWSFLPAPSPLAFWARRQAHETTIHHVDAEAAAGTLVDVDPALAVDGIDELLLGFFARRGGKLLADPMVTLALSATDARPTDAWTMRIGPQGREVDRGDAHGDLLVVGPASDLYLLMWNRRGADGLQLTGDEAILDAWQDKARINWS